MNGLSNDTGSWIVVGSYTVALLIILFAAPVLARYRHRKQARRRVVEGQHRRAVERARRDDREALLATAIDPEGADEWVRLRSHDDRWDWDFD